VAVLRPGRPRPAGGPPLNPRIVIQTMIALASAALGLVAALA